jgi:hypothetical protein
VREGDLIISIPSAGGSTYPGTKLPDDTPLKPLQVQYNSSPSGVALPGTPLINPNLQVVVGGFGGGFEINICNASANQPHIIKSLTARIDTVSPYFGTLNEWGYCAGAYDASSRASSGGGCGGAFYTACEYMQADFSPGATTGAAVVATQVGTGRDVSGDGADCPQFGALPVSLPPGAQLSVISGMVLPKAPGTYTVAFGVSADAASPTFVSAPPILVATVAHNWGGDACQTSAMQAQIPASTDTAYYICPNS